MVKRADVEKFLTKVGIDHSVRVEFSEKHYTVWAWVRDENGIPAIKRDKGGPQPIVVFHTYEYEDA